MEKKKTKHNKTTLKQTRIKYKTNPGIDRGVAEGGRKK